MVKNLRTYERKTRGSRFPQALIRYAVVAGLVLSLAFGGLTVLTGRSPISPVERVPPTWISPRTAGASGPIVIDGNARLASFCAGNGSMDGLSWATAYRLENYTIALGGSGTGIYINNTNAFLIIQNCSVTDPSDTVPEAGYVLNNVTNARVANCTSSGGFLGIYLTQSSLNEVKNNNITDTYEGIYVRDDSNGNKIMNNRVFDSSEINKFNSCGLVVEYGLSGSCMYNFIDSNTIYNYTTGIFLSSGANYTSVTGNNVSNNYFYGIQVLGDNEFNTIEENVVLSNGLCGINLTYYIEGVYYPRHTYLYHNWVMENGPGQIYHQIFTDGAVETVMDQNVLDWLYDSDGDTIPDYFELIFSDTNPNMDDSDLDTFADGYEVQYGSDPNDPNNYPALQHADFLRLLGYCEDNATLLTALIVDVQENASLLQVLFTYCNNNASVLSGVISDLGSNATLLQAVDALATQNGQRLDSLNITHRADIAALQAVVGKLGISVGDTDYDGLNDLAELEHGTSITKADTDNDGYSDGYEVTHGMDPLTADQKDQYAFLVGIGAVGFGAVALVLVVIGIRKKRNV